MKNKAYLPVVQNTGILCQLIGMMVMGLNDQQHDGLNSILMTSG
jgi:hypothetical protein